MSTNVKIIENQRISALEAQEIELYKSSFVLVPYQVSGIQDYTNRGATTRQVRPEDYETFKRVWTGNDAAQIQWKDSIYYTKNTLPDGKEEAKIIFQLGEVFLGLMEVNSTDIRIQSDVSLTDYVSQDLRQSYTFRIDRKQFELSDYHQICLWKIPEVAGSTLFRISSLEKDFIDKNIVGYVVTFESINQDLANTGSARQQNIMPSAIGQGYLECKVEDKTWPERIGKEKFDSLRPDIDYKKLYDRYITADYSKTQNRPAKKIVVKQLGLGIISTVACIGRPVQSGENFQSYKQPRLIFPINYTNASTPTLFHTQQETSNYYFGKFAPSIKYWKEWKQNIADTYQAGVSKWEYEGLLEFDINKLRATNAKIDGVYEWNLYGKLVRDSSEVRNQQWTITEQVEEIDTSMVIGCDSKYKIGGTKLIHDHMFDNYWTQKYMKVLPITVNSTIAMGLLGDVIGATIGGSFSDIVQNFAMWLVGTFSNWIGRTNPLKYQTFRGIICADFVELSENYISLPTGNKAIPLDVFKANGNNDTPASLMFNGNSVLTAFQGNLTDKFLDKDNGRVLSTINVGQKKFEDGTDINSDGTKYLLNGNTSLTDSDTGYIIDQIQINGIFNGEYSVEFLDENDEVIWSSIFQSAGMWSNSVRDTWTLRNTSVYSRENIYFDKPFAYPEKLDEPLLALPILETINCNVELSSSWLYPEPLTNTPSKKSYFGDRIQPNGETELGSYSLELYYSCFIPNRFEFLGFNKIKIFEFNNTIKDITDFLTYYKKMKISYGTKWNCRDMMTNKKRFSIPETRAVLWEMELDIPQTLGQTTTITLPENTGIRFYGYDIKHWPISIDFELVVENNILYLKPSNFKQRTVEIYHYQKHVTGAYTDVYFPNIQTPTVSTEIDINRYQEDRNVWYWTAISGEAFIFWYFDFNFIPKI